MFCTFIYILQGVLMVEQIYNFSKSAMGDYRCLGNELCKIFAENCLELG